MADVFISYAREDRLAAHKVAEALKGHGWSVWWDFDIAPGKTWDELIERELASASSVVVLWSATSLAKSWVKAEAAEALARGVLVPVLIEPVAPPLAFRQIQAAPLMDWRGDLDHSGFQQLICSICGLAGLPMRPEMTGKEEPAKTVRAKGIAGSARTQRARVACAHVPAPVAKVAEEPPPPRRENPEMLPPVAGAGGIVRRFAGTAAVALVAALAGYGVRDTLDRSSTWPQFQATLYSTLGTNTDACNERAEHFPSMR